jgi:hypothetical protein
MNMANSADKDVAHWAGQLKEVMQDAMTKAITNPEDAAAYNKSRQQYRMLKQVQGAVTPDKQISPTKLWQQLSTKKNANQTVYGQGHQDLVELAQAGKVVLEKGRTGAEKVAQGIMHIANLAIVPKVAETAGRAVVQNPGAAKAVGAVAKRVPVAIAAADYNQD